MDRKGEIPEGKKPFFRLPIMNYHEARPSSSPLCNPVGNVDRVMSMLTFTVMCWVQGYLSTSYNATYYGRCPACAYLPCSEAYQPVHQGSCQRICCCFSVPSHANEHSTSWWCRARAAAPRGATPHSQAAGGSSLLQRDRQGA